MIHKPMQYWGGLNVRAVSHSNLVVLWQWRWNWIMLCVCHWVAYHSQSLCKCRIVLLCYDVDHFLLYTIPPLYYQFFLLGVGSQVDARILSCSCYCGMHIHARHSKLQNFLLSGLHNIMHMQGKHQNWNICLCCWSFFLIFLQWSY